jgi:uncharacterized membrane protein YbaN (DUF454 family)
MGQGIRDGLRTAGAFLPKLVAFLLILLATWIVANIVARIVTRLLRRVGVDNLVAKNDYGRQVVQKSKGGVAGLLGTVAKVAVWLVGLSLAFRAVGDNPVTAYVAAVVAFIPHIIAAVAIIVVALWLASAVRNVLRSVLGGLSYGDAVATFAGAFIVVFGVLAALSQLNVAPAIVNAIAFAALFAIAGIAVVGVGGGLIRPMSERWTRVLDKVDEDAPTVRATAQARAEQARVRAQAQAYQPYPAEPAAPTPTPTPVWQPAGPVGDDTTVYEQGVVGGGQPSGARVVDPSVAGAPRPAGYNPEGYQSPEGYRPSEGYQPPSSPYQDPRGFDTSQGYRGPTPPPPPEPPEPKRGRWGR